MSWADTTLTTTASLQEWENDILQLDTEVGISNKISLTKGLFEDRILAKIDDIDDFSNPETFSRASDLFVLHLCYLDRFVSKDDKWYTKAMYYKEQSDKEFNDAIKRMLDSTTGENANLKPSQGRVFR